MILVCHVSYHWARNFLINFESGDFKTSVLSLTNQIFCSKFPKEAVVNAALSSFNLSSSNTKTYLVSSNPKFAGDASFLEVLNGFTKVGNYLWIGDKEIYYPGGVIPVTVSAADFFKEFYLEQNPQVAENLWQNRQIFGPRIPTNDYEMSIESAGTSAKVKFAVSRLYDAVLKDTARIIISGSPPLFFDNPVKILWPLIRSINNAGVWEVAIDSRDAFSALAFANFFDSGLFDNFLNNEVIQNTATIMVIPGAKKISVSFSAESVQEFDLSSGEPLFLPLAEGSEVQVMVVAKKSVSQTVVGAEHGVLIDPRMRPVSEPASKAQALKESEKAAKVFGSKI